MTEMRKCENCGSLYDPANTSDPLWGVGVTARLCGPCGIAEALAIVGDELEGGDR